MQLKQNLLVLFQAIVVLSVAKPKVRVFTHNGFAAIPMPSSQVARHAALTRRFAGSTPASAAKGQQCPYMKTFLFRFVRMLVVAHILVLDKSRANLIEL